MKFIVVADHPYYPQVAYCETLDEAKKERDEFIKDLFTNDGLNDCKVTVAEVINSQDGKSDY
jgi:hypothetical protein